MTNTEKEHKYVASGEIYTFVMSGVVDGAPRRLEMTFLDPNQAWAFAHEMTVEINKLRVWISEQDKKQDEEADEDEDAEDD